MAVLLQVGWLAFPALASSQLYVPSRSHPTLACPALPCLSWGPQVTPISVGPLPRQFVRDVLSTRASLFGNAAAGSGGGGAENLDTWEEGEGKGMMSGGGDQPAGEGCDASAAVTAAPDAASKQPPPLLQQQQQLQQHKAAALSLLRQRLDRSAGRGALSSGSSSPLSRRSPATTPAPQASFATHMSTAAAAGSTTFGEAPPASPAAPIPCTPTPQPPTCPHSSGHGSSSCSSSSAGTPFGTPLHIVSSSLLQRRRGDNRGDVGGGGPQAATAGMPGAGRRDETTAACGSAACAEAAATEANVAEPPPASHADDAADDALPRSDAPADAAAASAAVLVGPGGGQGEGEGGLDPMFQFE